MNAIHYSEYDCEASGNFLTEASLARQGFDIRVETRNGPTLALP